MRVAGKAIPSSLGAGRTLIGDMGKVYDAIDERWRDWIAKQPMFFVGTAPLDADGQ